MIELGKSTKNQNRLAAKPVYFHVIGFVVPKEGFEPTHPCGHYALNVARLPFRHFGTFCIAAL